MSHNYPFHLEAQHRAQRLRPDLAETVPARRRVVTTVPVEALLPIAAAPTSTDLRFDVKTVDSRGRVALTEARRTLDWDAGARLELVRGAGFVAVSTTDAVGAATLLTQARLQLPTWAIDVVGLRPGRQVLVVIDPAGEVRLYPTGALAEALLTMHAGTPAAPVPEEDDR
jgi:hypothetical protein